MIFKSNLYNEKEDSRSALLNVLNVSLGNQINIYLAALIAWTRMIPQFETLKTDDRVYLVQASWNEIVIADIAHRSIDYDVSLTFYNSISSENSNATYRQKL